MTIPSPGNGARWVADLSFPHNNINKYNKINQFVHYIHFCENCLTTQ